MKKLLVSALILCFGLGLGGCSEKTEELDTSMLTGAEAVSEDGTVSILLPDETFLTSGSSGTAMVFESEEEGFIYVEKGEEENASDIIPESEEDLLAAFGDIDAEFEIRDFTAGEEENGVKTFTSVIVVSNFISEEGADPENFVLLENITVDGETYYNAMAEITDENLIEKVALSLATFGDVAE